MTNYTKKTFYGTIIVFIFSLATALFAFFNKGKELILFVFDSQKDY